MIQKALNTRIADVPAEHNNEHEDYEYHKRPLVPRGAAEQCAISAIEIPPGKSAYPYHYHTRNEEAFYILSGSGMLRTPDGVSSVAAGDFLFFPANENGAHKLTNTSTTEPLVYLDFDTYSKVDVALYPDSGKIGIWGKGIDKAFRMDQEADYYDGE